MIGLSQVRQTVVIEGRPFLTASRAATWFLHCLLRMPATVAIEADGPEMRLEPHLRRYGSTSLYMKRLEYEPALVFLAGLVLPGETVLDVGANFGIYSLVLAARAAPTGACYAFEPGSDALAQLRRNCSRNPSLKIEVVPLALSDTSGPGSLFHVGGPTTFSLAGDGSAGEPVALTTLDEWANSVHLDRVDLMKVDVEGHEAHVFAGGRLVLALHKPLVMFEVSRGALSRDGSPLDAAWVELEQVGYHFYRLVHDASSLVPLSAVEEGNLFAVHPDSQWVSRLERFVSA